MNELGIGTRVEHSNYGEGIISRVNLTSYEVFFERGGKIEISRHSNSLEVLELVEQNNIGVNGGKKAQSTLVY